MDTSAFTSNYEFNILDAGNYKCATVNMLEGLCPNMTLTRR
jgi:hypothetical protein